MQNNPNLDELGRTIRDVVDRAVNSRDFQKLDQTIRQVVDAAVDVSGEAIRMAQDTAQYAAKTISVRKLYGPTGSKTFQGVLKSFIGFNLGLGGTISTLALLVTGVFIAALPGVAVTLAMAVGGGCLALNGARTLGMVKRFKTYKRVLGNKTQCALPRLAQAVGRDVAFVRKDVQKMIGQGLFLEGHLDHEQTNLITSEDTYRLFEQARLRHEAEQRRLVQEAANAPDPRVQEVLDKGAEFIARIRKCNDDIPGEDVSNKIYAIERVVQRIFDRAKEHPEVIPDLKKLMDYYLPMTVKLLTAYADMDAQSVQGEKILASKREIEATLDTLNRAFEKLLEELFHDTILDISSDITVLNTMLAREGLTDDDLTRMRKQQNLN